MSAIDRKLDVPNLNYQIYQSLLLGCFDKIKKTVPKKCKELRDICDEAVNEVNKESNEPVLNANKYFRIMKLALDTKIPRLTEQILYYVQKLVAHGLLDGNHPDDCLYTDEEKPKSNGTLPRKLIDSIVDEVCKCTTERDQQVQLQVVRALLTIVATNTTEVHERSLLKVMSSLYYIHIACANQVNQNTAKASLIQMISIVFKKMEQHSGEFGESLKRLRAFDTDGQGDTSSTGAGWSKASSRHGGPVLQREPSDSHSQDKSQSLSGREGPFKASEETKGEEGQPFAPSGDETLITFSPEDQYAQVTLSFIVDSVCLHSAKVEALQQFYASQIKEMQEAGTYDQEAAARLAEQASIEEQAISLFAVPKSSKSRKTESIESKAVKDRLEGPPNILNEVGIASGKFGWCVSCRNSANLYCKHTRHPVCSFECKQRHIRLLEEAAASEDSAVARSSAAGAQADEPYSRDALLVFNKLCQLLQSKDLDKKLENVYDVRKVLLGLDLIHSVLENPGSTFINRPEFVAVIRDSLCGALLKFAVSSEHKIFVRTVSIFHCLFLHFREHLKQTISVFIDHFFLRILDSGNSEYDYKYTILEFFDRLSENTDHVLEIFANYDCDIGQKDICVRIIDSLSSIAQGRFQRSEHGSGITPQQETSLRRQALEVLVKILRNLNRTIESASKLEGLAQARLAESRNQFEAQMLRAEAGLDSRAEEEGSSSRDMSLITDPENDGDQQQESKASGDAAGDARQQMQNRIYKSEMSKAAAKFNLKPKNGLKYLTDKGYLPEAPKEERLKGITRFLKTTPSLSATAIGDFLGAEAELNREVLSQYVDELDFTSKDLGFVEALKQLLQGFRLPGEAQQVDRFMEKFGEKLSRDRPDEFGNAEGVYLLSYATLMLQTSVHNPQAKKLRMTLADFRKITSSVKLSDAGQPDWDAFLSNIYDTVVREPFTLEEDEDARMKLESQTTGANRRLLFDKEREGILRRGAAVLRKDQQSTRFVLIKDISTIRPMFENTWSANLAVFSVVLDETEDPIVADLCVQGFMHAIRISGHYDIHDVRNAFVSSLSKFTLVSATKELKQKNINCIRELLNLAIHNGDCLRDSWSYVLECISKIDHMRVLGLGDLTDSQYFQGVAQVSSAAPTSVNQQILLKNSAIIADQIDAHQIESIFLMSERLNTDAIIDFIQHLCRVSKEELADEDSPKKFCLQKLVEVASLNMNRVRFQWQNIWRTLAEHFTWVGSHKNLNVVIYAIDSLRQLADKFLEKEERKNFSYQKVFLKPFETIMLNNLHSKQKEIKEYVVMCMAALCHQKAKFMKSGWEVVLSIFSLAAQDSEHHLIAQSFQSLEHATLNHFGLLEESFLELLSCIRNFAKHSPGQFQVKAMQLLGTCASQLSQRPHIVENYLQTMGKEFQQLDQEARLKKPIVQGIRNQFLKSMQQKVPGSSKDEQIVESNDNLELCSMKGLWFPILLTLTELAQDKLVAVRDSALSIFEKVIDENSDKFGEDLWRDILCQVFLPTLEQLKTEIERNIAIQNRQMSEHFTKALQRMLSSMNKQMLGKQTLVTYYTDILCLYATNICNVELSQVVVDALRHVLIEVGSLKNSKEHWTEILEQLSLLFQASTPKMLVEELQNHQTQEVADVLNQLPSATNNKLRHDQCNAQSKILLLLAQLCADLIQKYFEQFSVESIQVLLQIFDTQFKFAKEFNSEITLRFKLWKAGFNNQHDHLPGLLELEEEALKVYTSILFKQFFSSNQKADNQVGKQLFGMCSKVLKDYVLKHSELVSLGSSKQHRAQNQKSQNEDQLSALHETELGTQLNHQSKIIHVVILENLLRLSDLTFKQIIKDMGQLLIDLSLCSSYEVRAKNHKLLSRMFDSLH